MNSNRFEIDLSNVDLTELKKYRFIDIRHPQNVENFPINGLNTESVPYFNFSAEENLPLEMDETPTLFCCDRGLTSLAITELMRQKGYNNTFSLKGGYYLLSEKLN